MDYGYQPGWIHMEYEEDLFQKIISREYPADVVFEDEYILALNKKSGIVVHPGAGNKNGTLLNGLVYHYDKLSSINNSRPGIIHRLDKETSGLVLVAKTEAAHKVLAVQFKKREIQKEYLILFPSF